MMYWIVFALFTTLETFLDIFFSWFPFYYEIKILFILWVLSPATRGSSLLYKKLVHPMLISREKEIDELIEKTKQQGYSTFLQLFSSGFQYASNLFLHSAVKGQLLLGNQLKKSLSLNDVYDANTGQSQDNLYMKKMHETINEEEESSDYEDNSDKFKLLANKPVYNRKKLLLESRCF
jgi:receptor expression-enhancing protein 1/2/3/4